MGTGTGGFSPCRSIVRAQELRKIRMGFGIKSVNPIIINILISEGLGYTKEEGLAFTPAALGTNSNAQIAVDKGDTEFAVGTPSFQFPLFAKGQLPPIVNFYEYTYPYKWDVAVKPDLAGPEIRRPQRQEDRRQRPGHHRLSGDPRGAAEHRRRSGQGRAVALRSARSITAGVALQRGRDRCARLFRHRLRPDRRGRHRHADAAAAEERAAGRRAVHQREGQLR